MRRVVAVAIPLVLLALAGCASGATGATPTPTPTPTPESKNVVACADFANVTMTFGDAFQDSSTKDDWESIRVEMDRVALRSEGDVKERLTTLVDEWPGMADILFRDQMEPFNELVHAVGRACEAEGQSVEYNYLVNG
jgi:hypothetical protein